jgi:copper chaperone CopZ
MTDASFESTFSVPKMGCPSEENMIRMALQDIEGIHATTFDLAARTLAVVHRGPVDRMLEKLEPLGLGATAAASRSISGNDAGRLAPPEDAAEARLLWLLLAINAIMFAVEITVGFLAQSTGLVADALDMFGRPHEGQLHLLRQ